MKYNLIKNATYNVEELIELGANGGLGVWLPGKIQKLIAERTIKGTVSSYPIFKGDECYPLTTEIEVSLFPSLHELLYPLAKCLYDEYQKISKITTVEKTPHYLDELKSGQGYEIIHSFGSLYVDELILDTETFTLELIVGS